MQNNIERLTRIRADAAPLGVDALLLTAAPDVRYTCGFAGSGDPREVEVLLVRDDAQYVIVDGRNVTSATEACPAFTVIDCTAQGRNATIAALAAKHGVDRIGIDQDTCTIANERALTKALQNVEVIVCVPVVSPVSSTTRLVKDDGEVAHLTEAARLADLGAAWLSQNLRPGMMEQDVAWGLERAMRDVGAEALAFATIIGSGPNGAKPHHHTGARMLARGDAVVCDFGAVVSGYHSDLTRTYFIGPPTTEQAAAYVATLEAHDRAVAELRAGKTGQEIDGVARAFLIERGHPDIPHSLGHGIGLEGHEWPYLTRREEGAQKIPAGAVVAIEPGIYFADRFGIRIEDDYLVRDADALTLTHAPTALGDIIIDRA